MLSQSSEIVSWIHICVCIYTRVCVYTHMCTQCVHIVGCALVNACIGLHTHILSQARMHVYACVYVRPAHRGMTRPWPLLCGRTGGRLFTFPRIKGTRTRCLRCCRRARLSTPPNPRYGAPYSLNACVYVWGLGFRLGCVCLCVCVHIYIYAYK